jgi:hypothetical protein
LTKSTYGLARLIILVTVAVYSIPDGTVLAGEIPTKKHKLVVAWIEIHQEDLLADWQLAVNGKNPFQIRGLDQ